MSGCYNNLTGVVLSRKAECAPGLYCPNVDANNPATAPVQCLPSAECTMTRLYSGVCKEGYYCASGSIAPKQCPTVARCPPGTIAPSDYTGIVSFLVFDILLLSFFTYKRFIEKKNTLAVNSKLPTESIDKTRMANAFKKSLNGKDLRMDFEVVDLGYKIKSGKQVLKGVTGRIHASRMTAIMGPSGAGKTTFMNVLCGKVKRTSGKLFISGKETELSKFKKIYGFVPQEDIMHRELTVRENILHSARIRAPNSWSAAEIETYVDDILEALNLSHVATTIIGDGIERGVSGGQRKRVNIGIELAATPLTIFLDEPTSGLDSTSSLEVMDMLDRISKIGITVVAVIHQPRVEIFRKFDDVIMLAPGGRTAYMGPTSGAREYFERLGFEFPVGSNDADVLMDILSGQGNNPSKGKVSADDLVKQWAENRTNTPTHISKADEELFHSMSPVLIKERGANLFWQTLYCHNLSLLQQYRTISGLALELFVATFAGLLMGASMSGASEVYQGVLIPPYTLLSSAPRLDLVILISLLTGLAVALAAAPAGVKVFSEELPIYWRNAASGHSPLAYYIGKTAATLYRIILGALHFTGVLFWMASPITTFRDHYVMIFLMFWGVYGLASFVTMIVRRENATLLAVFCGYGISISKATKWGIYFIWALQFNMWASSANWSNTLEIYKHIYDPDTSNNSLGYTLFRQSFDYGMMFLIGCGWRVLSFACMVLLNRDKQQ
ncbi:P-loop containing nucleoside triphosphate hydrolase protein [Gorgonomyces haynaldii]|nr:P-loop containing nucleoside triphosphate hydrolase protein [Gorgonomyces haynaldii]